MNVARLVLPALRARDGDFTHEARAIDAALALGVGGFIVFGGTRDNVTALTDRLQREAGHQLLIAADLERGAGQQFRGLTSLPPPRALVELYDIDVIREAGAITAREARSVGVNWVFAPVADLDVEARNPIVQTRSFGDNPWAVAACVDEWIIGCQGAGALACVKHFPGHGRTVRDSHAVLPVVDADRVSLKQDLIPFRVAVKAGVATVMTAHVAYPALDPSGLPATRSPAILRILREELGFDGAVVTDALMMAGATSGSSEADAVGEVIGAGVDLLLYPKDVSGVVAALSRFAQESATTAAQVSVALQRREALFARIPSHVAFADVEADQTDSDGFATRLIAQGLLRGSAPRLRVPLELIVIDDDTDGDWPASSNTFVAEALRAKGISLGLGGSKVVLAFCEGRAGKGRATFGPGTMAQCAQHQDAALIVLFGHARLIETLSGSTPVLCAWHRQELMQRAAAGQLLRWLG